MHKKQQDRKRRKNPFEPQAEERFFRHNEGGTDYYSHAVVTVDRIVMDVMPLSGGTGLPTGAPAVTNGVLQTIDFVYSGTISELCRNGASYFAGVMANVKYYFGGAQIHGYDIKSNGNSIPDTVGSNDATVINPNANDWALYQKQTNGDWLGSINEIQGVSVSVIQAPWVDIGGGAFTIDGSQAGLPILGYVGLLDTGIKYKIDIIISNSIAGFIRPQSADEQSLAYLGGDGVHSWEFQNITNNNLNFQADGDLNAEIGKLSVRRLLKTS